MEIPKAIPRQHLNRKPDYYFLNIERLSVFMAENKEALELNLSEGIVPLYEYEGVIYCRIYDVLMAPWKFGVKMKVTERDVNEWMDNEILKGNNHERHNRRKTNSSSGRSVRNRGR